MRALDLFDRVVAFADLGLDLGDELAHVVRQLGLHGAAMVPRLAADPAAPLSHASAFWPSVGRW